MAEYALPDRLIHRLEIIAQYEKRTPAEVLETLLDNYEPKAEQQAPEETDNAPPLGTLARLAHELEKDGFLEFDVPGGGYSRELFEKGFGEYLMQKKSRWDEQ